MYTTSRTTEASASSVALPEAVIFGRSSAMKEVRQVVESLSVASVPVLILGERGTGKEIISREIHRRCYQHSAPFLKLSPGLTASSLDSAGNGAEAGSELPWPSSFAIRTVPGTLFIDEVSQLSLASQAKLLELFYDGSLSSKEPQINPQLNARVICASCRNLEDEVAAGRFRLELFYRISVVIIRLPSLRDRKEDIPELAEHFVRLACKQQNRSGFRLTQRAVRFLCSYEWPGNIRELENCVMSYVKANDLSVLQALVSNREKNVQSRSETSSRKTISLKLYTRQIAEQAEKDLILRVLREQRWNRKEAAKALEISYQTLLNKLKLSGFKDERRSKRAIPQTGKASRSDARSSIRSEVGSE